MNQPANAQTHEASPRIEQYQPFTDRFLFENSGFSHPVYKAGEGPGVLLMHEMPGMVPEFWRLAEWIRDAGFTVYAPDLYADTLETPMRTSLAGNGLRACISREIHLFAKNDSSPVTVWLRALAAKMHEECGGPGIGAIGLCMTGNFALSLALEKGVIAPVSSEPSLPLGLSNRAHAALHLSKEEQQALRDRADVPVMALRFKGDPVCRKARFDALEELVGTDRLIRIELEDEHKNPNGNNFPHAVLTKDLIDEEGSVTRAKKDEVIAHLQRILLPEADPAPLP
ncbi:dienelactone hydrolase [Aquisalinus flavus]|nr:dienelactone hydrolase family protein [Aquisalinus flavus]UNE49232.1 dienelactone hydrolase [Aquisalinus flavus]